MPFYLEYMVVQLSCVGVDDYERPERSQGLKLLPVTTGS